jgi:glycosyltransferase involved in cell wall biosynthesis
VSFYPEYRTIVAPHSADFTVVLPAYNAGSAVLDTIADIQETFSAAQIDTCILVVDDGSLIPVEVPPGVSLLRGQNQGKGAALRAGLTTVLSPVSGFMDADGAYSARSLVAMYRVVASNTSLAAVGSRTFSKNTRGLASRVFSTWVRLLHGLDYDTQAGIKVFSTPALQEVLPLVGATGFAIDVDLLSLLRRRRHFKPALISVTPRSTDTTTVSLSRAAHAFTDVATLRLSLPRRLRLASNHRAH